MRRASCLTAVLMMALAAGCSGEQQENDAASEAPDAGASPALDARPGGDRQRADTSNGPPPCVPACSPSQLCEDGKCIDLPGQCPCPIESYCDLSTNKCVAGCISDKDCKPGRYCDEDHQCKYGCRVGECGTNEVCQLSTRTCECIAGHHRCSGVCVAEGISSCGPSCKVCPTDPFGVASCAAGSCSLSCKAGYKMCGSACAACPLDKASSFACEGSKCVASQCSSGYHVCAGACALEDVKSCGPACGACSDPKQGACSSGACYGVVDFGYYPSVTTCAARCASQGKTCGDVCDIYYTRPGGSPTYHQVAGGHYTQQAAYQPWGYLKCTDSTPGGAPTSVRCCCTETLTGPPKPGCTKHSDCGSGQFCWSTWNECYPTTNSSCPPGYTYKGQCSNGTQFCAHSGLPSGTVFLFEKPCPAGTTQRGSFYCSGETKVCVPD